MSSPKGDAKDRVFPEVVLSGMRSTGELHLGHYFGVIANWLELQDKYKTFVFAADWHALTTDAVQPELIAKARRDNVVDWLSCGMDPAKSTIYIQSEVKQVAELHLLFSMITPLGWLERNPTYKEQREQLGDSTDENANAKSNAPKDVSCLGFLAYPVLQAADIAIVRGTLVPVGEDQLPHLELNREMVRRFVHLYKKKVFPEPKALLTPVSKLLGTDRRKMSKSYGNTISLQETPKSLEKKVKSMVTDPQKVRLGDPGRPEICNVFSYHQLFEKQPVGLPLPEIDAECRSGKLSCGACKADLTQKLDSFLNPIRSRRAELTANPNFVDDVLNQGRKTVGAVAQEVMEEIKTVFHW